MRGKRPHEILLLTLAGLTLLSFSFVFAACEPGYELGDAAGMASDGRAPRWFPDGDRIAFSHQGAVYVVDSTGSRLERVDGGTNRSDLAYGPSVSPDGSRIAYADYEEGWQIVTALPDGSDQRIVTEHARWAIDPVWWPNGKHILFLGTMRFAGRGLYLVTANGTGGTKVVNVPYVVSGSVASSPDGTHMAFVANVSRPGATDSRRVMYMADWGGLGATELAEETSFPSWSPDGRRIAFAKREVRDSRYVPVGVYTIGLDGSGLREIVSFPVPPQRVGWQDNLAWSPDGSELLFGSFVIAADGTATRELPGHGYRTSWSPDGSRVGVYAGGEWGNVLYTVARDGSDIRALVEQDAEGNLTAAGGRPSISGPTATPPTATPTIS